jgi:hypothetical protein
MIRRLIGGNHPKRHAIDAAVLDLVRRTHPLPVRVEHQRHHRRGSHTPADHAHRAIGPIERGLIQLLERIEHNHARWPTGNHSRKVSDNKNAGSRSHAMKFWPTADAS